MDAGAIDPTRGIETFGRRAHNAYMPPDPSLPVPGQWSGQDQAGGYSPEPHAGSQSQARGWAGPVASGEGAEYKARGERGRGAECAHGLRNGDSRGQG